MVVMANQNPSESEPPAGGTLTAHSFVIVVLVFTAMLLYVLSIGPACLLAERGWISYEITGVFYKPIQILCETVPGARELLTAYIALFIDIG